MTLLTVISCIAVFCTSVACLPQVYKVWKTKSAKDISYLWIAFYSTGCVFWLTYGFMTDTVIIKIADSIVLSVQMTLLASKFYIDRKIVL